MFKKLLIVGLMLALTACADDGDDLSSGNHGYMDISAEEAKALIDSTPELVIIDVSPYYSDGHLPGAVSYPVGDGSLDDAIPMLNKNGKFLVYCHADEPSITGANKLVDAGFTTVYRLIGNYSAWVDAGYDVVTGSEPDGDTEDGDMTDGDMTDGDMTDGDMTDGDMTDGDMTDGDMTDGYMDISPQDAWQLIQDTPELVIIDVSGAYAQGHLPGAVNYPLGDALNDAVAMLDANGKYLVYCHVDAASIPGAQTLVDAGFETVYRLEGNYGAWLEAGLPIALRMTAHIENISMVYDIHASGVFNTPVGSDEPGPLFPEHSFSFNFTAAPGHKLSFATMFGQSNDLFYGPGTEGIALFDGDGMALSGDVTSQIYLWDAGTEVNEEPGAGPNQAPRQSAPDTGTDENGTLKMIEDVDDGFTYPEVSDVLSASLTYNGDNSFTLTIENVSTNTTLMPMGGEPGPVPLSPGAFAVHSGDNPLLATGGQENGLERIAEDGNPTESMEYLAMHTGLTSPFAPGAFAVHMAPNPLFEAGSPNYGHGLEAAAEDGDPSGLASALAEDDSLLDSGFFNTPVGADEPGPLFPGHSFEFSFDVMSGYYLSFETMLGQSNDLFYGPGGMGIPLFNEDGSAKTGDATMYIKLWDAGTEVNEEPGIGPNQAPRQSGPDTGDDEGGNVREVDDGFTYPSVSDVIKVTLTAP